MSSLDGKVTLTLPNRVSEREARRFVEDHSDWLDRQLSGLPGRVAVAGAAAIPFEGADLPLHRIGGRHARLSGDGTRLLVPDTPEKAARAVRAFLRLAARDRLSAASDRYAARVGRGYAGLSLRDPRSRWGSCSSAGGLMYSWRLIMAPGAVLDYVAAHEVAHLVHMDHSSRFWAVVADLCPDYRIHRTWLREHGSGLHRWDFGD